MQRRATALWAALFIVLTVGAYAFIGAAQEPALVEDPDHSLSNGTSVQLGDVEYTFEEGDLTYFNESARGSESFEGGGEMEYRNATYVVNIPNETDPNSFTLRHALPDDAETVTVNETDYVVVERDGERTLVEPQQYIQDRFGDEATHEFAEGDQIEYDNNTADVTAVDQNEVTIAWDEPQNESIVVQEGDRLTLGGTEYVVHFPAENRLLLSSDIDGYESQADLRDSHRERINGVWAVAIISGLAAITLIGLAYMPSRY